LAHSKISLEVQKNSYATLPIQFPKPEKNDDSKSIWPLLMQLQPATDISTEELTRVFSELAYGKTAIIV